MPVSGARLAFHSTKIVSTHFQPRSTCEQEVDTSYAGNTLNCHVRAREASRYPFHLQRVQHAMTPTPQSWRVAQAAQLPRHWLVRACSLPRLINTDGKSKPRRKPDEAFVSIDHDQVGFGQSW